MGKINEIWKKYENYNEKDYKIISQILNDYSILLDETTEEENEDITFYDLKQILFEVCTCLSELVFDIGKRNETAKKVEKLLNENKKNNKRLEKNDSYIS